MSVRNEQHIDTNERAPGSERIYDLVAIDVDGTLVTSENKLSHGIASLIRKTQARGIGVTLVSGRPKLQLPAVDRVRRWVGPRGRVEPDAGFL